MEQLFVNSVLILFIIIILFLKNISRIDKDGNPLLTVREILVETLKEMAYVVVMIFCIFGIIFFINSIP